MKNTGKCASSVRNATWPFSSAGDNDEFRYESYLEIPAHRNGAFTFYSRDEVSRNTAVENDFATINSDPLGIRDTSSPARNYREIGYNQTLFDGFDISLSAFTEKFDVSTAWPGIEPRDQSKGYNLDETAYTSVRQGLTLSGDYRPSNWLSFTPSLTYFEHTGDLEHLVNVPKRTLGLNTQLSPLHNSWSLSMLVQYTDGENLTNLADLDNKINSLDMSFKLGIALTENLQFSIISKYDKRSMAFKMMDDSSLNQPLSSDVAMVFDFSY